MPTRTLLERAKDLLQSRAGTAAAIIVPLALSATAQAASVIFTVDGSSVKTVSGGDIGSASSLPSEGPNGSGGIGVGVSMWGSSTTVSANDLAAKGDGIVFHWEGSVSGSLSSNDTYNLFYDFTPSITVPPDDSYTPDPITWFLSAKFSDGTADNPNEITEIDSPPLYSSTQEVSAQEITGAISLPIDPQYDGIALTRWEVNLTVIWDHYYNQNPDGTPILGMDQQLTIDIPSDSTIELTRNSNAQGGELVPLPAAVWAGMPVLGAIMVLMPRLRRGRGR